MPIDTLAQKKHNYIEQIQKSLTAIIQTESAFRNDAAWLGGLKISQMLSQLFFKAWELQYMSNAS
jgi:hypothetical protein